MLLLLAEAYKTNSTIKEIVIKKGLLSKESAYNLLNPINLVNTDM
ncbi:hypothetical protein ACMGD3_18350 [Lysinibacillus sphaericus]